jgi:hypothetical protein
MFQEMFEKSAGKPIEYQGKTLVMMDNFPTEGAKQLRLVFEECNGQWRQGVALRFEGKFKINGQIIRRGIVLWHDTAPQTVELEVMGKPSTIEVKNVWDVGDGVIHSWHNGAAMIVEPMPSGRRYRCNDGFADDDFNDIIFRLERVESA